MMAFSGQRPRRLRLAERLESGSVRWLRLAGGVWCGVTAGWAHVIGHSLRGRWAADHEAAESHVYTSNAFARIRARRVLCQSTACWVCVCTGAGTITDRVGTLYAVMTDAAVSSACFGTKDVCPEQGTRSLLPSVPICAQPSGCAHGTSGTGVLWQLFAFTLPAPWSLDLWPDAPTALAPASLGMHGQPSLTGAVATPARWCGMGETPEDLRTHDGHR